MQHVKTHPQGPVLSRIITGAWRWHTLTSQTVDELIHTSLDAGITTFDHADIYGDYSVEQIFGKTLRRKPALRERMQLITKCGIKLLSPKHPSTWIKYYDTSATHIVNAVENSLKMLCTDRIDVLLIHRPDPLLDPTSVAEAFSMLKQQGKVLHVGVSNFTTVQFEMLQSYLSFPLVTNQIEVSLLQHNSLFDGTVDALMKHRVSPMAWSPLGGGNLLTYSQETLFKKAEQYQASGTQLALAWLLKHPAVIFPVIGTTRQERIVESARAVHIDLDRQDWFSMLKTLTGNDVP
jgi:predicted oxidoreductase